MIALETLTHDTFAPLVGQRFKITAGEASAELVLANAQVQPGRRPEAIREPFSILFRGAPGLRATQGIYHFEHETLGAFDIFITQVKDGPQGSEFEAIFT